METPAPAVPSAPKLRRLWVALVAPPVLMFVVFMAFGAVFAMRGLRGEEIGKAINPISFYPTFLVFALVFALTAWLSRRDGLSLASVGWRRLTLADVGLGLGVAAVVAAANQVLFHPLIRSATPGFDPTISVLGPIHLAVLQVVGVAAEDTLYRGYALTRLPERFSWPVALIISTVAYALLGVAQGPAMFAWSIGFGLLLGAMFLWRKSLWSILIAHYFTALVPRWVAIYAAG